MPFGICGAHRSGKTTLARAVAEKLEIHFEATNTSEVMRAKGFEMVSDMSVERRIAAQEALLDHHEELLHRLPRPVVLDRTPLDMIAYMLGEVTMHNTSAELGTRIMEYVDRAHAIAATHYDSIFVLRPLPVYEVAEGKPPLNPAYQWGFQMLAEGSMAVLADDINCYRIPTHDPKSRIRLVTGVIQKRLAEYEKVRNEPIFN